METNTPNISSTKNPNYIQHLKNIFFNDFKKYFVYVFWKWKKEDNSVCISHIEELSEHFCNYKNCGNTNSYEPLTYNMVYKLFQHFENQDPTNQMFYKYIFHEKNLYQNPLTEKLCLLNQSAQKE
jgi:hypothetical protein